MKKHSDKEIKIAIDWLRTVTIKNFSKADTWSFIEGMRYGIKMKQYEDKLIQQRDKKIQNVIDGEIMKKLKGEPNDLI